MISLDPFSKTPRLESFVDVTEYGEFWKEPREIGVVWDDPRDIYTVILRFKSPPKEITYEDVSLQYWQNNWPKFRGAVGAGGTGWGPIDDFYNGQWKEGNFTLESEGGRWIFRFSPINEEFPEYGDFKAEYRRTLKVRLTSSRDLPEIESFEAYTNSVWKKMDVAVEYGCLDSAETDWSGSIEVFNGKLANMKPLSSESKVKILTRGSWESKVSRNERDGIELTVWYAYNGDLESFDETIVTLRSKAHSFSFSMKDVERGEQIFIKDYDVLVSKASDRVSLKKLMNQQAGKGLTLYELVGKLPEQTLAKAWEEMPAKKKGIHFIIGCKGRRQKFGVNTRGVVFCPKLWNVGHRFRRDRPYKFVSKYSDRFLWAGDTIAYSFGFPNVEPVERRLEEGYLPIINARWVDGGFIYEQEAYATLLFKDVSNDLDDEENIEGDDPIACMVKITLRSQSPLPKKLALRLGSICKEKWRGSAGIEESLQYDGGFVYARQIPLSHISGEEPELNLRYLLETNGRGNIQWRRESKEIVYEVELLPDDSHTMYVKIPSITLSDNTEFEKLKAMDYNVTKEKVVKYWSKLLNEGAKIEVPDKWLNDFYRAYPSHVHISDDKEPDSQRYMCRVSSFNYGVYANESCMVISELDRRGLHEAAERRLEVLTHYQGTAVMAGKYSTSEGVFYGAGGYECGLGYGQHHGWSLWCLAEHYKYTGDKEWLKKVASNIVKACDWIIKERQATMRTDRKGRKVIEYGFLPAGGLEDVSDYWHWAVTNAHSCRGLSSAAEVLGEINHPEALRLKKEAEAYKRDLLEGINESAVRSPVVKLRDGTWVPHFPCRPRRRGRDRGWLRETLEGAIHGLVLCQLFNPRSKEAEWILKDYEDNLYISELYGYSQEFGGAGLPDFDRYWFSRGGFSMQPNLYGFQIPYLWRDDVKQYLRAFFNSFAVAFYPDTLMLTEHPLPTMGDWAGDHFKTSDEAISCYCLRLILICEEKHDLHLLPAIPRCWLEEGKQVSVTDAVTHFGTLSFKVESKLSKGFITMTLNPSTRNPPESTDVRFRHPDKLAMRRVEMDGRDWTDFDVEKELVRLGKIEKETKIVAYF